MKNYLFLFIVVVVAIYSCQRRSPPAAVTKDANYEKAASFLDVKNDSAYYYFNKVVTAGKDSLQVARAYNNMAVIQYGAGDYFGAQEMLIRSMRALDEHNPKHYRCLASDYDELGLAYMKLKNYEAALPLFDSAYKYFDNDQFKRIALNNKALTLGTKGDHANAVLIYQGILSRPLKSKKEYARTLTNLAITHWRAQPSYDPRPVLYQALMIRKAEKDIRGQNASYMHLSDYYMQYHPDSALLYTKAQMTTASLLGTPDDRLDAFRKLVMLSPPNQYRSYFTAYQQLSDSLQTARNAAKNQFALIRYDTEKRKADNLKLQRDNAEKKYQLDKQRVLLGLAALLLLGSLFWYRKRKQRMLLETQTAIKENELRLSKKVHDVVANGLYQVMQEVQYQDMERNPLLDRIDHLYKQSRNISYDIPISGEDFDKDLNRLLQSFASEDTKVLLVGNAAPLWEGVSIKVRAELEHILRELMVNMSKHSKAQNVVLKFASGEKNIRIRYTDDGVGMPVGVHFGNGLTSTGNRIRVIGGNITFEPNGARGLRVEISFPIS